MRSVRVIRNNVYCIRTKYYRFAVATMKYLSNKKSNNHVSHLNAWFARRRVTLMKT